MGAAIFETFYGGELVSFALRLLAVWLVGLLAGWLLPKPKWVDRGLKAKALLLSTPPGLWFRRVAVAAHLSLIVREVWRNLFAPGTFRGVLRSAWLTLTTGQRFCWPQPADATTALAAACPASPAAGDADGAGWYVGGADLEAFKAVIDGTDGGPAWEPMMDKQWPGCTYTAWRRTLPSGRNEYKSVTISEDATAEEYMDFYLDDDARMGWDSMISEAQLLESGGPPGGRGQVVRWLRTFPFSFISQREYVIARRFFRDADGALYACTKGVEHPAAPFLAGVVRMEGFHSHWRSRTVACPLGSGRPAVETVLLHFEDFKIPERMARFAVRHGMAGFVKGMIPAVQRFVAERRLRCGPTEEDPASFGQRRLTPAPASSQLPRAGSLGSASTSASESVCSAASDDTESERSATGMKRSGSLKRLGAMMVASGVAIALARTASGGALSASASGPSGRSQSRRYSSGAGSGQQQQQQRENGRHSGHSGHRHRGARSTAGVGEAMPPRPRRRRAEPEPAAVVAMQS